MTSVELTDRLNDLMNRHSMTRKDLALYLGVPPHTVKHWLDGTRMPSAATIRLLQVLGIIEAFAPAIHNQLIER